MIKLIRRWRMMRARPYGVCMWFDPKVEHVELLDGPAFDIPMVQGATVDVDGRTQSCFNGMDGSVSGRGKREALRSIPEETMSEEPNGSEDIPF